MFFFFSSRRRHTRWTGDWSSDVCSSDLQPREEPSRKEAGARAPSASWPLLPTDELLPGDGPQEEPTRTQTRLQGITRVSTPLGPGRLFQETPLAEQVRRGHLAIILDDPQHGGRRLTCFLPQE